MGKTEKKETHFEDFLMDISPEFCPVTLDVHGFLVEKGCAVKLQETKSGHVVSFADPKSKKVVANFVSRKSGPVIRIYADNVAGYEDCLQAIPEALEKLVAKAGACKRMLDPEKCNSRCAMGYDFTIKGTRHQKCRYNCFLLPLREEHRDWLCELLGRELQERAV